jgi:hypothetical protein
MAKRNDTIVRDKGANKILRDLKLADKGWGDAGYWGAKKHADGTATIPYIASIHEYGTINQDPTKGTAIPERSFMRTTVDENKSEYRDAMKKVGTQVLDGVSFKDAMSAFLEKVLGDIRQKLTRGDPSWEPLADSTKANRKHGGDQPLFDTGALANSGGTRVFIRGSKVAESGEN